MATVSRSEATAGSAITEHAIDRDVLTLAWLARILEGACTELTLPQYRLLSLMVSGDDRARDLAAQLELAKPTVSATIDTLADRGLVERASVAGDRRAVRLTVTPEGSRALAATEAAMRERLDNILRHARDSGAVERGLEELTLALEAMRGELVDQRVLERARRDDA